LTINVITFTDGRSKEILELKQKPAVVMCINYNTNVN